VWVKWDVEFANNGEGYANEMPIALKDDLHAKEKTHMGWNLLTEEHVRWAALEEQQQQQQEQLLQQQGG
jgi:hypothetical protein